MAKNFPNPLTKSGAFEIAEKIQGIYPKAKILINYTEPGYTSGGWSVETNIDGPYTTIINSSDAAENFFKSHALC